MICSFMKELTVMAVFSIDTLSGSDVIDYDNSFDTVLQWTKSDGRNLVLVISYIQVQDANLLLAYYIYVESPRKLLSSFAI